jgi:hypothetical protein
MVVGVHRLAADRGVRAILDKYSWVVGVLRELSPAERTILGYNRNRGMEIALRLRAEGAWSLAPSSLSVCLCACGL